MEMILGNGFCEMSQENLMEVDGGLNWKKALAVFAGILTAGLPSLSSGGSTRKQAMPSRSAAG